MDIRINNIESLYSGIDKLIKHLQRSGYIKAASKLQAFVHETAWTTGSELLGELNLHLNKTNYPLDDETQILLNECKNFCKNHRRIMGLY